MHLPLKPKAPPIRSHKTVRQEIIAYASIIDQIEKFKTDNPDIGNNDIIIDRDPIYDDPDDLCLACEIPSPNGVYESEVAEYKKRLAQYEIDLKAYDEFQRERELQKAEELLKKANRWPK